MAKMKEFIRVSFITVSDAKAALRAAEEKFSGVIPIGAQNLNRVENNTVFFMKTSDVYSNTRILQFLLSQIGALPEGCHVKA